MPSALAPLAPEVDRLFRGLFAQDGLSVVGVKVARGEAGAALSRMLRERLAASSSPGQLVLEVDPVAWVRLGGEPVDLDDAIENVVEVIFEGEGRRALVLEGGRFDGQDEALWRALGGALEGARRRFFKGWRGPVLVVGPGPLLEVFAGACPSLWGIRERDVDLSRALAGAEAPAAAESPALEAYRVFVELLGLPEPRGQGPGWGDQRAYPLFESLRASRAEAETYRQGAPDDTPPALDASGAGQGHLAAFCELQGRVWKAWGDERQARRARHRALLGLRRLDGGEALASTWGQLAGVCWGLGDLGRARALRLREIEAWSALRDEAMEAVAWLRVSEIDEAEGRIDEALALRRGRVIELLQGGEHRLLEAQVQVRVAELLRRQGKAPEARALWESCAARLRRETGPGAHEALAAALGHLAGLAAEQQRLDDAVALRRQQADAFRAEGAVWSSWHEGTDRCERGEVRALLEVGGLLLDQGRFEQAQVFVSEALVPLARRRFHLRYEHAQALDLLAEALWGLGQGEGAIALWRAKVEPLMAELGEPAEVVAIEGKIARKLRERGLAWGREQAIDAVRDAIQVARRFGQPTGPLDSLLREWGG